MSNPPSQYPPAGQGSAYPPGQPPQAKQGSGTVKWLLIGCAGFLLLSVVVCAGGAYWAYISAVGFGTDIIRSAVVSTINQSEMSPEDKQAVIAQVDRVAEAYKDGKISNEQLTQILQDLASGPLMAIATINFIEQGYVEPSGLSEEEKLDAKRTVERTTRGLMEKSISKTDVQIAISGLMETDANGHQQLKNKITDEELQHAVASLKHLADEASIPDEAFKVDVAAEIKKSVDSELGASP